MDIAEVRAKFPQYADMSDGDLAQALHKRYYSDLPFDKFAAKIGVKLADADPVDVRQQPATTDQKIAASLPMRVARGVTDSLDAGAQYLPWALGAVSGGFGTMPNRVSDWFFNESDKVSKGIDQREAAYQAARKASSGDVGFDSARLSGNFLSPITMALGAASPAMPAARLGQAAVGAGMGMLGALTAPVPEADSSTLGASKAGQATVGAVMGAVATPAVAWAADKLGPVVDRVAAAVSRWRGTQQQVPETVVLNTIRTELARENISLDDIPETILRSVRKQVGDALNAGRKIDPSALVRQADFEAVGTRGTLGQITRDPVQYTREVNLRGVAGAGDPLARRFAEQRQAFGRVFNELGSGKADDAYAASSRLTNALSSYDKPRRAMVDATYDMARDSAGRSAPMNTGQFSKAANDALDEKMLGTALPADTRALLNDVSTGKIPLNVNNAVQLRRVLEGKARDLTRQGDSQGALAVRQIVSALEKTDVETAAGAEAVASFGIARKAARFRFESIERNPALKAFLDGDVAPDRFVGKFVINGATDDLKQLAKILNADGRTTVRQQIAAHLEGKAFGSNVSGDSAFAVERYNQELQKMGREKLSAFFTPQEIDKLYAVGRAAGWAGKRPAGSAVNESNTAAAAMNLFQQIRGASIALPVARQVSDSMLVSRGLLAKPPTEIVPTLSPALREFVPFAPVSAGVGAAGLLSY